MTARVLVVSCGGTIASRASDEFSPAAPVASGRDLVDAVPTLRRLGEISTVVHSLVPSSFETLDDVLSLLRRLRDLVAEADSCGAPFTGIVVTHGTDTMEEAAFVLDLFWADKTPLVVTGAMRNGSRPGADGPANLVAAVSTALSPAARGIGVVVVFNDVIHSARLVRKTHTANVATFESSAVGPLGFVSEGRASVLLVPRRRPILTTSPLTADAGSIALLTVGIGDDARILPTIATDTRAGVVVESMGGGHLPPALVQSRQWLSMIEGHPVVLASRTGAGPILRETYDFAGSEIGLRAAGLIPSGILDGLKSRVLLALLIGMGAERAEIARAFADIGADSEPNAQGG